MQPTKHDPGGVADDLLGIYLNDHLAAATAGVGIAIRLARAHRARPEAGLLEEFAHEMEQDRTALVTVMDELGVPVRRYKMVAARVTELIGRAKLNGRLLNRSPLSDLVELEALLLVIEGNAALWRTVRARVDVDPRLDAAWLDSLIDRSGKQREWIEDFRARAAAGMFGGRAKGAGR